MSKNFTFSHVIEAERDRLVLWAPVVLGMGIVLFFSWPAEPALWIPLTLSAGGLLAALMQWPGIRLAGLSLLLVGTGFLVAFLRAEIVAAPVIERQTGPVAVAGQVERVERYEGGETRVTLTDLSIERLQPEETPKKVRLRVRTKGDNPSPGDRIEVLAILLPPPSPAAPGAFDFSRRAWFLGLGAVGFAVSPVRISGTSDADGWSLARYRDRLSQRLAAQVDGPAGGVAVALMTGERGLIPEQTVADLRAAGLAHLLAISGLHIGLMAGFAFFVVRAGLALLPGAALRYPIKKWAAVAGILAAFFYLLISGATVPTQRAFAMTLIVFVGVLLDRLAISMRLVALVATGLLLLAPENILAVSFQMSFAAVIALVAAYEAAREKGFFLNRNRTILGRIRFYLLGVVLTTLIAGMATGFFATVHFNRFPVYDIAANLGAVPIFALWIMPWALVAFILLPLGLEGLALVPMTMGIDAVIWVAAEVASWPGAVARVPDVPVLAVGCAVLGGLWLCLWRTRIRLLGLMGIAASMAVSSLVEGPDILVNEQGTMMAVRDGDGRLVLVMGRGTGMTAETWLRGNAQIEGFVPRTAADPEMLSCDSLGCVYSPPRQPNLKVAFVLEPESLKEDCARASLVISAVPAFGRCRGAGMVIDRFDLWRGGAHGIWLEDLRVETVAGHQGRRRWSRYRDRIRD